MARHGLSGIGVDPPRPETPVGGVEDSHIERGRREERFRVADVPPADLDAPGQTVQFHAPPRHRHELLLDVDPQDPPPAAPAGEDQRDDAAPRPQIDALLPLLQGDEMGKEKRVDGEAIARFFLDDPETTPEDRVDRLPFFPDDIRFIGQIRVHDHSRR